MDESLIRIPQPGDEQALETFLQPHLEASLFLVNNMRTAGLVDHGQRFKGTYAAAFEEEKIVGVVTHYWNQNLIYSESRSPPPYLATVSKSKDIPKPGP